MRFIALLISVFIVMLPASLQAENFSHFETRSNPWADNGYTKLIEHARYAPYQKDFPFFELRNDYARSAHYLPRIEPVINDLTRLIFIIENNTDLNEIDGALKRYHSVIESHLGNITVMDMAQNQAKKDIRFGDKKWLGWFYKGLVRSLTLQQDGTSLKNAYRVISFDEENFLFDYLRLNKKDTELVRANDTFIYHRHTAYRAGKSTSKLRELYVDITYPMQVIEGLSR